MCPRRSGRARCRRPWRSAGVRAGCQSWVQTTTARRCCAARAASRLITGIDVGRRRATLRLPRGIGEVVLDVDDDERDTGAVAKHAQRVARGGYSTIRPLASGSRPWANAARTCRPSSGNSGRSCSRCDRRMTRLCAVSATTRITTSTPPSRSFRASRRSSAWMSVSRVSASQPARRPASRTTASHAAQVPGDRHRDLRLPARFRRDPVVQAVEQPQLGRVADRIPDPGTSARRVAGRPRHRRDMPGRMSRSCELGTLDPAQLRAGHARCDAHGSLAQAARNTRPADLLADLAPEPCRESAAVVLRVTSRRHHPMVAGRGYLPSSTVGCGSLAEHSQRIPRPSARQEGSVDGSRAQPPAVRTTGEQNSGRTGCSARWASGRGGGRVQPYADAASRMSSR